MIQTGITVYLALSEIQMKSKKAREVNIHFLNKKVSLFSHAVVAHGQNIVLDCVRSVDEVIKITAF